MRVIRLPEALSHLLSEPKATLLIQSSSQRAVLLPVAEYERLVAVSDWHERLQRGG